LTATKIKIRRSDREKKISDWKEKGLKGKVKIKANADQSKEPARLGNSITTLQPQKEDF